ncbi:MAG TPA: GEVED domain-containing protein [Flavipsychrobacter sp.]|nr:GEVED domain-containing protein [Flavipsychrobacter sp.]
MRSIYLSVFCALLLCIGISPSGTLHAQTVTIGSTSGTTSYFYGPYYRSSSGSVFNYSRYGYLYTATELGIPAGSFITQIEWYKASGTLTGNNSFSIWLDNTSATTMPSSATWGTLTATATSVYSSTTQSFTAANNSWESFPLTGSFIYTGGSLQIFTDHVKSGTASAANNYYVNTATDLAVGYANSVAATSSTALTTTGGYGNNRPTIRITYIPGVACTGTPVAGTINATSTNVCPNQSYTLTLTGATAASGLSYQWSESPVGLNSWTPISGATNPYYTTTMIGPMDYRATVTCVGSATTPTLTINQNTFVNCYCASLPAQTFDGEIFNTTVGTLNNSSTCSQTGIPATSTLNRYSDYTNLPATTLAQGGTYPVSVTAGSCGGSYSAYVKIFVDYDHDGAFTTAGEEVYAGVPPGGLYTPTGVAATGTFTVSSSSLLGQTRMRVILHQTTVAADVQPCSNGNYNYGETEDYLVDITAPVNCASVAAGVAASNKPNVCLNETFTLSATGYTLGASGIMYQWEESPAGLNSWSPVANATNPYHNLTQTIASDYRLVVTCMNNSAVSNSTPISVPMSSFYLCYCSPKTGTTLHSCCGQNISNVTITGTTLNNSTTTTGAGYYTQYPPNVPSQTGDLQQGTPYNFSVTQLYSGYGVDAWIDYDQNGVFDASEYLPFTGLTTGTNLTLTQTLMIPYSATPGLTGMRVRMYYPPAYGAANACQNYGNGYETEDYVINILTAPSCTGTPNTAIVSGPSSACNATNFNLSATGFSTGVGISYQWESSPAGLNSWAPIANATLPTYTANQSVPTDYRFVTYCSNTGGGTSTSLTQSVTMSSYISCYCASGATNLGDGEIKQVTIGTLNNLSTCSQTGGTGSVLNSYSNYVPTLPAVTLAQGVIYPFTLDLSSCGGSYGGAVKIFIDYDQSGTFDLPAEEVYYQGGFSYAANGSSFLVNSTINIPLTATTGNTVMRVILVEGGSSSMVPCGTYGYGETEDYLVTIAPSTNCTGNPAVSVVTGPASVCPSVNFTLTASGYTTGSGITYQWEESPSGLNSWSPIANATNPSLTYNQTVPMDYRFVTTCSNTGGGSSNSNVKVIPMGTFLQCYCIPTTTNGCNSGDHVTNVTFASINNNTGACISGGSYSDYKTTVTVANIAQNASIPISVSVSNGGTEYAGAWIDYDQNGVFDASEYITLTDADGVAPWIYNATVLVPSSALLGQTGFRVRSSYNATIAAGSSCSNTYSYGETEDYVVNITLPATCPSATALTATGATATSVSLGWTPLSSATQWQVEYRAGVTSFTLGTGTRVSASSNPYTLNGLTAGTLYTAYVRDICGPGDSSAWAGPLNFITAFPTLPGNDSCNFAVNISNGLWFAGTTSGATQSIAGCDATNPANDVWYTFTTGPNSGSVVVEANTNTTGTDVVMETFSGACGTLTTLTATSAGTSTSFTCIDGPAAGLETATYSVAANTTYKVRVYGFVPTTPGAFLIRVSGAPLAIKLDKISATNVGKANRVEWNTLSEERGDKFELQRSIDGKTFATISEREANGTPSRYTYMDNNPFGGINYYRLMMKDASGTKTYSATVSATVSTGGFSVDAFPNPVTNNLTVKVNGVQGSDASVQVTDVTGKTVKTAKMSGNTANINMSGLANGIYLIKYADADHTQTIRVTKQ